jgi:hypothetical protein
MSKEKEAWLAELKAKINLELADSKIYIAEMEDMLRKEI